MVRKFIDREGLQSYIKGREGEFHSEVYHVESTLEDGTKKQIPHIGYGFKIEPNEYSKYNLAKNGKQLQNKPKYTMSPEEGEERFQKEFDKAYTSAAKLAYDNNITDFEHIGALTDLAYNMGTAWHKKFPRAKKALEAGDYATFTRELLLGKNPYLESNYVKDVGIDRVTTITEAFGHNYVDQYKDGSLYKPQTESFLDGFNKSKHANIYLQPTEESPDSITDRVGFVEANKNPYEPNPRLKGNIETEIARKNFRGKIRLDDRGNVSGQAGINIPSVGYLSGNTEGDYSFESRPYNIFGADVSLSKDNSAPLLATIQKNNFLATVSDEAITAQINGFQGRLDERGFSGRYDHPINKNVKAHAYYGNSGNYGIGIKGVWNFQEGGEVEDPFKHMGFPDVEVGRPIPPDYKNDSLEQLPVPPIDFDRPVVKPPGAELGPPMTNFPSRDNDNFIIKPDTPVGIPPMVGIDPEFEQLFPPVISPPEEEYSFRPPEDYESPRISTSFADVFGYGGDGNVTAPQASYFDGNSQALITVPNDNSLSRDQLAALGLLGTMHDVGIGMEAKATDMEQHLDYLRSLPYEDSLGANEIVDAEAVKIFKEMGIDLVEGQSFTQNLVDTQAFDIDYKYRYNKKAKKYEVVRTWNLKEGKSLIYGQMYENKHIADHWKTDPEMGAARSHLKGVLPHNPNTNKPWASEEEFDNYLRDPKNDANLKGITKTMRNGRDFLKNLGDKELFNIGDSQVQLKDLYDEMGAALMVGLATGDAGKAALAGGVQFVKSDVIKHYATKAGQTVYDNAIKAGQSVKDAKALQQTTEGKWKGWGGAATAAAGTLLLGGDEEDALYAAVSHLAIERGAEAVGGAFGAGGGEAAGHVGAGIISAGIALLRTGDLKQAAISGVTGYAMSVNPLIGMGLMALQFILGKEPSNKTGYASVDFDQFSTNSYSIGHYDSGKMNEDNMDFTKQLLDPLVPFIQELESKYGFDLKGDLQIHYGSRDGLFYTIGDIEQEGLSQEGMFLNRADYWDGQDRNVYRRKFDTNEAGLQSFYESIQRDLEYIAQNKVGDLKNYRGRVQSPEEIKEMMVNSGYNYSNFAGIKQGGKISLDKGGDVEYNKGNYGFVNEKGKAPPSARADDVPMTLKEGDFVLSQPAVALYGKDTINRMLSRAATKAGKNLKSGGKVPVNVHNGEYIIPKNLTEYIGPNVLETMNNKGLMSVGERPNT
tara:strand:+ start:9855 stop:13496 length:3642 start_codon:yes stop_codon:yes gene_type:complete